MERGRAAELRLSPLDVIQRRRRQQLGHLVDCDAHCGTARRNIARAIRTANVMSKQMQINPGPHDRRTFLAVAMTAGVGLVLRPTMHYHKI
jgi:hypothetical protein